MSYLECRHIFAGGCKCKAPALTGQPLCYFHGRAAKGKSTSRKDASMQWNAGPLEDADTIQLALSEVLEAIANGQLDPRRGGLLLYGLQVAAGNVRHARSYLDRNTVREVFPVKDGTPFGPSVESFEAEDFEDECSDCEDDCEGNCDCDCHEQSKLLAQAARLTGFTPPPR
ncbi:MAG: hypothetical protein ACR2JE_18260 [Acidobacteriaceae bacterium]